MRVRRRCLLAALALVAIGACSDDDTADGAVSQDAYDDLVDRLCESNADVLNIAFVATARDSDAEEANYYTGEFIPRARAMVNRLAELGFPPEQDAAYRAGLNQVLTATDDLAADPYRFIDMRHRNVLEADEDYLRIVREGFAAADVDCVGTPTASTTTSTSTTTVATTTPPAP